VEEPHHLHLQDVTAKEEQSEDAEQEELQE